jgi:hypothetical protein
MVARGVVPFLQEALALLPEGMWLRTVRADSGFFDGAFLDFLEARGLPYVVVARLTSTLKRKGAGKSSTRRRRRSWRCSSPSTC